MSVPRNVTRPELGRVTPERRLKSVVLPAPLGRMITRNSPSFTSRLTSSTIVTPRMRKPSPAVDITAPRTVSVMTLFEWMHRRRDRFERNGTHQLRRDVRSRALKLRDEHRLQHRMIRGAYRSLPFGRLEGPAFERGDHLPDVLPIGFFDRAYDHLRADEAVGIEQVWDFVLLLERGDQEVVGFGLRRFVEVMR